MAKIISQETFDEVVQENIVDLSMSPDEAREETIKQFEAQGINLANIIKDLSINSETGKPRLNEATEILKKHLVDSHLENEKLLEYLKIINGECQKSLPHRMLAAKIDAHSALTSLLETELNKPDPCKDIVEYCLQALNSFTNKQPDYFNKEALRVALKLLTNTNTDYNNITALTLQWLRRACLMHEMNRTLILETSILEKVKPLVSKDSPPELFRDLLALFRFLVLDDDIRVEFGNAHEHARKIANEYIVDLTKMLNEFTDLNVLADLLLTIGTLAVRQEFCTTIADANGVKYVFHIMTTNYQSASICREALKLLRALAGNDKVKATIVAEGVAPIIKTILETHMNNENVVAAALGCISTLTLRVKQNSVAFFETGIAEIISMAIQMHAKNKIIQRNGAWTVRNMVSRSREQCETWLSFGIEESLNAAMSEHPSIQQDIKAALRDLGCKVELKEEFTGTAEKKIIKKL